MNIIYAHLDSISTVSTTSTTKPNAAGSAGDAEDAEDAGDAPNNWGTLISQSNNGRSSTYESYTRSGAKIVRHVYWTQEAAEKCHSCDHRYEGGH
ncbi:MAG: hypothetical protein EXQ47_01990 [Bryobacterales bacterium]|nr:hypothetical protein [Bryobacterales bacterium]